MTFTEATKSGFSNYVNFTGRASRSAFWYWVLFAFIVGIGADIVDYVVGTGNLVGELWGLATLLPNLAVGARRLHDTNRSGFWLLIGLVPLIGWIWLLVLWCLKGTSGKNRFGEDPLA